MFNFHSRKSKQAFWGLFFVLPWIFGFVIINAVPIFLAFSYSLTDFNILRPEESQYIGLENFKNLFMIKIVEMDPDEEYYKDLLRQKLIPLTEIKIGTLQYAIGAKEPLFWKSIYNTAFIIVVGLPFQIAAAYFIAFLLSVEIPFVGLFRSLIYLPTLVPHVVVGVIWGIVLNPKYGPINFALGLLSIKGPNWRLDPAWTKPAIILILIWGIGGTMLILMAAIKDVPKDYYEAAEIDGANWLQKIMKITLPITSPAILFVTITGMIFGLQTFTVPYVYAGPTGQPRDSLLFYAMNLYNNAVVYNNMGEASALGVVLFLITLGLTGIVLRVSKDVVHYRS